MRFFTDINTPFFLLFRSSLLTAYKRIKPFPLLHDYTDIRKTKLSLMCFRINEMALKATLILQSKCLRYKCMYLCIILGSIPFDTNMRTMDW